MDSLIVKHWLDEEQKLPGINCIAYPDGTVTILNCYRLYDPNNNTEKIFCFPLCDTTIDSIEKYDAAYWTLVDEWASIDYRDGKIYGGDGQLGNQGFVACTDAENNLVWGMFFENTNPIKHLEVKGKTLIAINEHDELQIEINLEHITDIKMKVLDKET